MIYYYYSIVLNYQTHVSRLYSFLFSWPGMKIKNFAFIYVDSVPTVASTLISILLESICNMMERKCLRRGFIS